MQTPKFREKLLKLPGAPAAFGKVRAALQSARAFPAGSGQAKSVSAYETTEQYQAHQFEVERLKAMAEEYARNLRQRMV